MNIATLTIEMAANVARLRQDMDNAASVVQSATAKMQKAAELAGKALGFIGVGLSLSAFTGFIRNAIDAADALDEMSGRVGVSAKELSGLQLAYKQAGMGNEAMASSLAKLSREMSEGNLGLRALGVNTRNADGSLRGTTAVLLDVADKFKGMEDGAAKTALAMEIFGKSGAEMVPLLNSGAEGIAEMTAMAEKLGLVIEDSAAAQAGQFNDTLELLGLGVQGVGTRIAAQLLPTLNKLTGSFLESMTSGDRLSRVSDVLAAGLKILYTVGVGIVEVFSTVGKTLGAAMAQVVAILKGNFSEAAQIGSEWKADVTAGWSATSAAIKAAWSEESNAAVTSAATQMKVSKDLLAEQKAREEAAKKAAAAAAKAAEEAKKKAEDGAKLAASLLAQDSGLSGDFAEKWEKLNAAYAAGKIGLEELTLAQKELLEQQPLMKKAHDEAVKASQAAADARHKEADGIAAFMRAQEEAAAAALKSVKDRITSLQEEEQAADMSRSLNISLAEAVERVAIARLQEKQAGFYENSEGWENLRREIEERQKLLGLIARKDVREREERGWTDMWSSVDRTAHDVFVNVFDGGSNVFKKLGQTLKASVLDLLYQMTVRKWIINIGTSLLGGGFGAAANAATGAAGATGAGLLGSAGTSVLGSMMGGASALGIGASYGFQSLFANGLGATLSAGSSMIGAGSVMSGLGTIAGALGPIALGVGAVVSLVKKLDDSGTIHTGALSQYSAAGGLANSTTHGAFGMGFGGVDYSAETEKFTGAMAQSIVQMLDSTATTFGKEAGYKAATAFADDTSKDGAWGGLLITKLEETIVNWDPTRTSRWAPKEFADGAAGKEQYLAAVAADVRVALDSIGLPAWATGMLDKLGQGASIEQLAGAVDQINAAKAAFASFGQYMPTFAGLADSAISKLVDASGGAQALAGNMATFVDQFYSDADKLAVNTENVRAAMGRLGFEMPRTRAEFAALVQANVALGDAGAETVAKLLQVAGAFAQVTPAVESASAALEAEARAKEETARAQQQAADDAARRAQEIARERYDIETELYNLLGDTNKLRERELATIDASNRSLKEFVYSLQDAFSAVDDAFGTVQRSVAAQKNALAAEFEAGQAQRQKALSDAQSVSGLVDNISRAISNAVAAQSIDSKAFDVVRRSQAQARLDGFLAALRAGGSVTELPGLDRVLGTLGKDSKAGFSRFEDYAFDRGVTAGKLAELGQLADAQKTVAEKTLEEITAGNEAAQTAYAAQQAALDATLAQAQSMYDAMKGIDTSVLSVAAAMQQFSETLINLEEIRSERSVQRALMQQGSGTAAARQSREFTDAELIALGFDPKTVREEAAWNTQQGGSRGREGLEGYINGLVNSGSDMLGWMLGAGGQLSQYAGSVPAFNAAQYIAAAQLGGKDGITPQELQTILGISGSAGDNGNGTLEQFLKDMPKFADGGIHAGGWRLVGERGPELEYTPPSRIYNAADTISLLQSGGASNAEIAAALREMAARLDAIEANTRATAGSTAGTNQKLHTVVQNGAIRVRTIA